VRQSWRNVAHGAALLVVQCECKDIIFPLHTLNDIQYTYSYTKEKPRMPALDDILSVRLQGLDIAHTRRFLQETEMDSGVWVMRGDKKLLSFSGNDYLGLRVHPEVIAAGQLALAQYGAGAGASRLVTGSHPYYAGLEAYLAHIKQTQAALVFGSGYLANLGVISALMEKDDLIIADRLVHACMLDGARLSGAKLLRFRHNDVEDATRLLAMHRDQYRHCLVMTETVFSMDGDIAPLAELSSLAQAYDAWLLSDDAHGLGVVPHDVCAPHHIQTGTLSKAAGAYGGYVCGSSVLVDYLVNTARSFIFSTALPPCILASAHKALELMQMDEAMCRRPVQFAQQFTQAMGLPLAQSAIVPVMFGKSEAALRASAILYDKGVLVTAIRPPTVPQDTARLRVTFSALHTPQMVMQLVDQIQKLQ
jgi:8-amino-7-oxononanoate synthase